MGYMSLLSLLYQPHKRIKVRVARLFLNNLEHFYGFLLNIKLKKYQTIKSKNFFDIFQGAKNSTFTQILRVAFLIRKKLKLRIHDKF